MIAGVFLTVATSQRFHDEQFLEHDLFFDLQKMYQYRVYCRTLKKLSVFFEVCPKDDGAENNNVIHLLQEVD